MTSKFQRGQLSRTTSVVISVMLALGGAAALALIFSTEPVAQREAAVRQTAMLVQLTQPERGSFRPVIETLGTVMPAREIMLTPRVGGEVVEIADAFDPGGFVRRGEMVVRIDDADYRNLLLQRQSELEQAIAERELELGQRDKAEQDYRQLGRPVPEHRKALILREPQLRSVEAAVQSARAAEAQARLDLDRTNVRAPFDAHVLSRDANVGSQVNAGEPLGRLAGVDTYWVEATIPLDKLRWLSFAEGEEAEGSRVEIRHRTAWEKGQVREGRLYRLIGELEGETRLARALVTVDDPLARSDQHRGAARLMIGAFVECRIEGREIRDAVRLSRAYLRANNTVWLMRDGALAIQPVEVVFEDAEYAYIQDGLDEGDQVVTTSLATVREGVPLRVENSTQP